MDSGTRNRFGILHFLWLVKADVRKPLLLGAVLITLLVLRLPYVRVKQGNSVPEKQI